MSILTVEQKKEFNRLLAEYRRLKNGAGSLSSQRNAFRIERSQQRRKEAQELFDAGVEISDIARDVGVSETTIRSYLFDKTRYAGAEFSASSFNSWDQ